MNRLVALVAIAALLSGCSAPDKGPKSIQEMEDAVGCPTAWKVVHSTAGCPSTGSAVGFGERGTFTALFVAVTKDSGGKGWMVIDDKNGRWYFLVPREEQALQLLARYDSHVQFIGK